MIRVVDSGFRHVEDLDDLHAFWVKVEQDGRQFYRATGLLELVALADDPQARRYDMDGGWLGKAWGAVTGLYNAGVNFVYAALGIFKPAGAFELENLGLVQLYGAAASADTLDAALENAARDLAAVKAAIAGYAQSKMRPPDLNVLGFYVEFVSRARRPLVLLGHPDPRVKRRSLGRDGALPEAEDDLATEQNEILFRGLAKLRENFVFQVTTEHVPRSEIIRHLDLAARVASNFASRRRGSKSVGVSVSIPVFNALANSFTGAGAGSLSHGKGVSQGVSHGWGEAQSQGQAHSVTNGTSVTDGHVISRSGAQSTSSGQSTMQSHTVADSVSHSSGSSQSSSSGSSWTLSHSASLSQGTSAQGSVSVGFAKIGVGGNTSVTEGWSGASGTMHSTSSGTFESTTTSHGTAETTGTSQSTSVGQTSGWSESEIHSVSSMHAETDTVSESHSTSQNWGRAYNESIAEASARSTVAGEVMGSGLSFGLAPGVNFNRTWQVEDDLAERLTEITRGIEALLNAASHSGGFITSAYLITDSDSARAAAETLSVQAFYGQNVPTPVVAVSPSDEETEQVKNAAMVFLPYRERIGNPNDPYDGWLFWKGASLLPADKVAAYIAPALFREGTLKILPPIPEGMAFYPDMPGDVVLGHQYSPATADLTNAQVRLDRKRLMHTLFAGDTGWGKSVAAMRMVYEVARKWAMRVVVLDFGYAWRTLLNAPGLEGRVDVRQLRPDGVRPLRWNPLQIGTHIDPEMQLGAFVDIFGSIAQLGQKQQQHRLMDALRAVYQKAGVLVDDPEVRGDRVWGVVQDEEAQVIGAAVGTPLGDLTPEQRQRLAVLRSRKVGIKHLYVQIEIEYNNLPPRDQVGRGVLEGILWRLKRLVQGKAAAQFDAGYDTVAIEDLGRPNGVVILEGGKFLDNFTKAWLLGWAGWLIYADMVARRERQINRGEPDLFMVFEEANIIFSGLDGSDPETRTGPSVSEQYANMFRDSRKYGAFFGVITQSPSLIPQGIISSCNNLVVGFLKNPDDKDIVVAALARSEKGFMDEPWRRFITDMPIGMVIGRFPYVFEREYQMPILFRPLTLTVPEMEPTDEEIAQKLGRITL